MQITLSNQEVEAAVRAYVSERVVISPEAQVTLTEGTDGITASVDLGDETKPLGIVEKTTRRPRQPKEPKASEAAPAPLGDDETKKEEPAAVEQTPEAGEAPASETAQEAPSEATADSATTEAPASAEAADGGEETPAVEPEGDPAEAEKPETEAPPRSLFANLGRPKNPS